MCWKIAAGKGHRAPTEKSGKLCQDVINMTSTTGVVRDLTNLTGLVRILTILTSLFSTTG